MRFPEHHRSNTLATGPTTGDEWALNEEAIRNLGYMQMKKTQRCGDGHPEESVWCRTGIHYYVGHSHGGREALTVAQRYPRDYEGIISNVPIVNFSTLMVGPVLSGFRRIRRKTGFPPHKARASPGNFCARDHLDGLQDGIISNYVAARQIFNVHDGIGPEDPWARLRASGDGDSSQVCGFREEGFPGRKSSLLRKEDPTGKDSSGSEKMTAGQIKTLNCLQLL
jgi:feruloyl esterase